MLTWLSRDEKIIFLNRAIRSFAFGFISIVIAIYLKELGLSALSIGILLSSSMLGGALFSILVGRYAVTQGLKKMFLLSSVVSVLGITLYLLTNNYAMLIVASLIAFISPSGRETGPFLSLEQAYLSFTSQNKARTFSSFNITSNLAVTLGGLLGFLPSVLQNYGQLSILSSFKAVFILYLLLNLITLFLYSKIAEVKFGHEQVKLSGQSKKVITKLSLLFGLDVKDPIL